jgi:hypothetical protein
MTSGTQTNAWPDERHLQLVRADHADAGLDEDRLLQQRLRVAAGGRLGDVGALGRQRVGDQDDEGERQQAGEGDPAPLPLGDLVVMAVVHG